MVKLCECGCGLPAPIAKMTKASRGHVKGQPVRFRSGHANRLHVTDWRTRFIERDAGYVTPCLEWPDAHSRWGYGIVVINRKNLLVHRLVWTEAHGDPGELFVCHHCDNPPCGRLDHLFLGTHADNMRDAVFKGRMNTWARAHGEEQGQAKLTEAAVLAIRANYQRKYGGYTQLAREYGVSPSTIKHVVNGRTWRHLL